MRKIIRYILISFFVFILFNYTTVRAISNGDFVVNNIGKSYTDTEDEEFDSGKYFFMELFCGAIGVFMVVMAIRTTDKD